jgi:phenylacetate-CoA ligase
MENKFSRWLYDSSPVFLQHVFTSAYGLQKRRRRYGKWFRYYFRFFSESAKWPLSELQAFQDEQLRKVISNAYENVPFYHQRMDGLGLKPSDIQKVADLPKLPFLEKSDLRDAGRDLLSRAVPGRDIRGAPTSGSTGFPVMNHWTPRAEQREYAFHWARRRPGISRGQSYGSFTGLQLLPAESLEPPFWRLNWAAHQTCYSVFHMTPETIPCYLEQMKRSKHVWLEGYPSPIATLAKDVLDRDLDWACPPQAVFTTAEQLQPQHRRRIETAFRTRVYDQYGQNEKAASVTEYECGHLHYDMDHSIIEFLPLREEPEGIVAEMVCTAFDNEVFPLIRYRIGDLALLPKEPIDCNRCASPVVLAIYGRTAQALRSRDGRIISNISVIAKRCQNVEGVQCVQYEPGSVQIHVVKGNDYTAADEQNLIHQFRQKMGQMDFKVVYVPELQKTASGKTLSIISRVG